MNIEIKDLNSLIERKECIVADYKLDLNDLPLSIVSEVYSAVSNPQNVNENIIFERIIFPLIKRKYKDETLESAESKLNHKQILLLWNEIIESIYPKPSSDETGEVKKK